jgi:thiol-disulfide isomerase/thioredoxin
MFPSHPRAAGAQLRRVVLAFLVAGAGALATSSALPIQDPGGTPPPAPAPVKKPAGLKLGDKAPALAVAKWVKGDAVPALESGKSYVVMFWATWNDPSKRAIPHVTELQKKYPDITFIGVSCWEKEKDQSKVEPFVTEMGDKMAYHIATDLVPEAAPSGNDGAMAKTWMSAAGRTTVPAAFVVDKGGLIGWIGHPMDLDPVVDKLSQGKWDTLAEAKKVQANAEVKARAAVILDLEKRKKWKECLENCDAVLALDPTKEKEFGSSRYHSLLQLKEYDKAYAYAA